MSPSSSIRRRRTLRRVSLLALAAGGVLATSGCGVDDLPNAISMPDPITENGQLTFTLWQGSWFALLGVGVVVWGLILVAVFKFRRKRGETGLPPQVRYNLPIEIMYTAVPFVMIVALFYFTARDQNRIYKLTPNPDQTVQVIGQRWSWTFNYVNQDVYTVGTPGVPPTLVVPEGESIRFKLQSADVIHSFWIPAALFKMDVIPGRVNQFETTFTRTGTYAGKCAELCGVDHSRMLFNVRVVSPADYTAYVQSLRSVGQVGQIAGTNVSASAGNSINVKTPNSSGGGDQ